MANGKKYYWLKLKESFMTSDTVDYMMSLPDGANYVVLYQMLCLKTINTNGRLERTIGDVIIPFNIEKIQRDFKWFSCDTIRVALELYKSFGLVYEDNDGVLTMAEHKNLVGYETDYAIQKRNQREGGGHCPLNVHENVHTENRDKRIENRDKRIENRDREKEKENTLSIIKRLSQDYSFSSDTLSMIEKWAQYKIERKESYKEQGAKSLLTQIQKNIDLYGENAVLNLIDECMANNWKGIIWDKLKKDSKSNRSGAINWDEV